MNPTEVNVRAGDDRSGLIRLGLSSTTTIWPTVRCIVGEIDMSFSRITDVWSVLHPQAMS